MQNLQKSLSETVYFVFKLASKCWFCLSNPNIESHLIISVISETYVTLAKGGLVDHHLLIVPIEHYSNSHQIRTNGNDAFSKEVSKIEKQFDSYERKIGKCVISFESYGGSEANSNRIHHMHVQLVPIPIEAEINVEDDLKKEALNEGLEFSESFPSSPNSPFIKIGLVGKKSLYISPPKDSNGMSIPFNLTFGRYFLAKLMGTPLYADWKKCILEEPDEIKIVELLQKENIFDS